MSSPDSVSSRRALRHARLARRLTLAAAAGLLFVLLLGVAGVLGAAVAVWQAVEASNGWMVAGWLGLAVLAVLAGGRVLRLLWVPVAEPVGVRLSAEAAPALHYRVDEVRRRFEVAPLDGIWVTDEMNASVLQRPAGGVLGRIETHLMIGLPLAHCLTRRQFLAVLAHEFGHLAAQRQGLGGLGAHLRGWWLRVADAAAERYPALERWLDARFRAYTLGMLRLSRLEEFEADAVAARLVGRRLLGQALVEVTAKDRFLREDYWPKVLAQCMSTPEPRFRPFREMGLGVAAGFHAHSVLDAGIGEEGEDAALALHPSPADRLRALRVPPGAAVPPERSAAVHYLGDVLPHLAWAFDRAWWQDTGSAWRYAYRQARRSRRGKKGTRVSA